MIRIKDLTVRNFMSVGNATQAIAFDRQDLTLILGENLDLGGNGARNGVGKSTILNALSYAFYGQALTNIRRDNLINKTNGKGMLVSLEFDIDGRSYKVERGRKPAVLRFFVDSKEQEVDDNAQGDSRQTQSNIEHLLGMSHDMFKHIVALNTYTEPFLSLGANNQRQIIEQLLGITMLSEKAALIKDQTRITKDKIQEEDFRIKAVQEANARVQEQIDSLKRRQQMWDKKRNEDLEQLTKAIEEMAHVDIEIEITAHKELKLFKEREDELDGLNQQLQRLTKDLTKEHTTINKLVKEIADLHDHKCYACGQDLHDEKHNSVLSSKEESLADHKKNVVSMEEKLSSVEGAISNLGDIGVSPTMFYSSIDDAYNHKGTLDLLQRDLETKLSDTNPYTEQVDEMERQAIQEVSYDKLNEISRLLDHQEFLLKLLTNKDSFIRKKIIEQNLSYLNTRLTHYLNRIGLPHQVVFQNDLTVEISDLGRELDFDNLSRGERGRLIVSLSFAFRDVWESLYSKINLLFVDELLDNGFDSVGVEAAIALLKQMCRENNKSVWLVSHRDDLASRCENTLMVVKENGYTTFDNGEL